MELHIEHLAKIEKADIRLNGITVIAGENNTGKSTVGKALFAVINSLSGIQGKIEQERQQSLNKVEQAYSVFSGKDLKDTIIIHEECTDNDKTVKRLLEYLKRISNLNNSPKSQSANKSCEKKDFQDLNIQDTEEINRILQKLEGILNVPDEKIEKELVTRYFSEVFHKQINCLYEKDIEAKVEISDELKQINVSFVNNKCISCKNIVPFEQKVIYIDNPFVTDNLRSGNSNSIMEDFIKTLLVRKQGNVSAMTEDIVESVMNQEKMNEIFSLMNNIIEGDIIESISHELLIQQKGIREPLHIESLSAGVKSFALIKLLLEKVALQEGDIVVLDEPEIHLHPQWQMLYAEIIVLLQKKFNLKILVTTHSPYFLDAINLFSCKYEINERVKFYLAELDAATATMEDVTGEIEQIYKKMATPIQELDTLRYELQH